jgi:hypothetical protein
MSIISGGKESESDGSMGEIRRIPADLADLADWREGKIAMGLST